MTPSSKGKDKLFATPPPKSQVKINPKEDKKTSSQKHSDGKQVIIF